MKFNIPKVIRRLEMSAYAEEMDGLALHVWVNPSRNIKNGFWDLQVELGSLKQELDKMLVDKTKPATKKVESLNKRTEEVNKSIYEWYANIWSQVSDPDTHVSAEELAAMADDDPAIWTFMAQGTQALINDHTEGIRKN